MERYDLYKDSGVEWIGEIPSHWIKSKLKFVSEIVTGNTPPTKDEDNYEGGEYLWVKPNEINGLTPTNDTNQKLTEKGKSLSRVLPPFSVLVNGIGRIGEFGYSEMSVSTNQQINSIVYNHKVDKRYGLFHTSMMKEGFISNSEKVVVPILNKTKQENIEFVIPPLSEQQQIVSFLDIKTSLIDSLIKKTQRKIELLKEKRTSLINEVVTKGLNPNVELKDSDVEWIGKIPSHWFINKVGNNTYVKGRIGWKGLRSEDFKDEGPYLITGTDFNKDGTINWDNMYHVDQWRYDEDPFIQLQDNDVLITKDGTIGKVVYVGNLKGQTCLNSGIFLTRPTNKEYKSRFFFWLLNSNVFKVFVDYNSGGSTIQHLYQNVFVNFKFPIPPISEQQQIVSYLDEQTQLIDKTISIEEKRIELLKEYRQSLISEVVTGKRKVVE